MSGAGWSGPHRVALLFMALISVPFVLMDKPLVVVLFVVIGGWEILRLLR